jgi:hypothetical protein
MVDSPTVGTDAISRRADEPEGEMVASRVAPGEVTGTTVFGEQEFATRFVQNRPLNGTGNLDMRQSDLAVTIALYLSKVLHPPTSTLSGTRPFRCRTTEISGSVRERIPRRTLRLARAAVRAVGLATTLGHLFKRSFADNLSICKTPLDGGPSRPRGDRARRRLQRP